MLSYRQVSLAVIATAVCFAAACTPADAPDSVPVIQQHAAQLVENHAVQGPFRPIYVVYTKGAPTNRLALLSTSQVRTARELGGNNRMVILKVPSASNIDSTVSRLRTLPWVVSADAPVETTQLSGYRRLSAAELAKALRVRRLETIPWGIRDSHANAVDSAFSVRGSGIKVAIIDGGIDCSHSDLSVTGGVDYVGTGYCADTNSNVIGGVHYGHGTLVAGVLAGQVNGSDVRGMAPDVSLYSVSVCNAVSCANHDIKLGIDWAVTNGMNVVNISIAACSFATSDSMVTNAIANAWTAGVFVAISASVDMTGCSVNPLANATGAVPVSAMDSSHAYFTSASYSGTFVRVSAYGVGVLTDRNGGGTTTGFSGTSLAVPHVAGAAALGMARGFNNNNMYQLISAEAYPRGTGNPDTHFGYGSLDAMAAVQPTPQAFSYGGDCATPLYGNCTFMPVPTWGFRPFKFHYHVEYSMPVHSTIDVTTTDSTYAVPVPTGPTLSYTISMIVTISDSLGVIGRRRTSQEMGDGWVVCPVDGGGDNLRSLSWTKALSQPTAVRVLRPLYLHGQPPIQTPRRLGFGSLRDDDQICP